MLNFNEKWKIIIRMLCINMTVIQNMTGMKAIVSQILEKDFLFNAMDFYLEISTLVLFLLFRHWMEMKSLSGVSGALNELIKLIPKKANLIKGKNLVKKRTY